MKSVQARLARAALLSCGLAVFARCGGSPSAPPPLPPTAALASVKVSPDSIVGGSPVTGTATLTTSAPAGGATVALHSSDTNAATVPDNIAIAQGTAGAEFQVATKAVGGPTGVTISGSYLGLTTNGSLNVLPAPVTVRAVFSYAADSGTSPPATQCSVTKTSSGPTMNVLRCRFDASASTPNPGITNFRWQFPGGSPVDQGTNPVIADPPVPCGTFSGAAARGVTLTITAPQGSDTTTTTITFVKGAEC
jgi:hypothetical protein